jgi:hypothetical protein
LIDVNGVLEAVNPPGQSDAVLPLPAAPGVTTTCVAVGPAFTTAWSKTVVSVASSGTGSTIELSLVLRPSAITNAPRLADAMAGRFAVEVLSQGEDIGRAVLSHSKAGPVVKLTVTPQVATSLKQQLGAKA